MWSAGAQPPGRVDREAIGVRHRPWRKPPPFSSGVRLPQKPDCIYAESVREIGDCVERQVPLTALDRGDVGPVVSERVRELLL